MNSPMVSYYPDQPKVNVTFIFSSSCLMTCHLQMMIMMTHLLPGTLTHNPVGKMLRQLLRQALSEVSKALLLCDLFPVY